MDENTRLPSAPNVACWCGKPFELVDLGAVAPFGCPVHHPAVQRRTEQESE